MWGIKSIEWKARQCHELGSWVSYGISPGLGSGNYGFVVLTTLLLTFRTVNQKTHLSVLMRNCVLVQIRRSEQSWLGIYRATQRLLSNS